MGPGVVILTDLDALVGELADRGVVPLDRELGSLAREVYAQAVAAWPVATGRSRAALRLRLVDGPGGRAWTIVDPVPYAGLIVQRGQHPQLTAARLLYGPIRARLAAAAQRAADAVTHG